MPAESQARPQSLPGAALITFHLEGCSKSNMAWQMVWRSASVNRGEKTERNTRGHKRSGGESGENRCRCQGHSRGFWCCLRAPPCGLSLFAEAGRARDMSLIFHTINTNYFAMQGKYTASQSHFSKIHTCMQSHTQIPTELYLATAYKQDFVPLPPSVSNKTTCMPYSKSWVPVCLL